METIGKARGKKWIVKTRAATETSANPTQKYAFRTMGPS